MVSGVPCRKGEIKFLPRGKDAMCNPIAHAVFKHQHSHETQVGQHTNKLPLHMSLCWLWQAHELGSQEPEQARICTSEMLVKQSRSEAHQTLTEVRKVSIPQMPLIPQY